MLTISGANARTVFEEHDIKSLHVVLKAGISASLNEINRTRTEAGYKEPGGDGAGAITVDPVDGEAGLAVYGADPDGAGPLAPRLLGRVRTTVVSNYSGTGREVLVAVAVWPSFADVRRVLAAEAEISPPRLSFPYNPLSIVGDIGRKKKRKIEDGKKPKWEFKIGKDSKLVIQDANDPVLVPAVNITDPQFYDAFTRVVDAALFDKDGKKRKSGDIAVEGSDKDDPGTVGYGSDTITNDAPGVISQESMEAAYRRLLDTVNAGGTVVTDRSLSGSLPDGTYYLPGMLEIGKGQTLSGSGTLIVQNELKVKQGGTLDWDGEIIVADDDEKKTKGTLKVESGGTFEVDGVVAVLGGDDVGDDKADAKVEFKKKSESVINGALLIIGGDDGKASLKIKKETDVTINGILAMMAGKKIDLKIDKDDDETGFTVNGSMALVVPDGASNDDVELKVHVKKANNVLLNFDVAGIRLGEEALTGILDPDGTILPLSLSSYWERGANVVLEEQKRQIDDGGPWGY
jgi:hypothetical protein